MANLLDIFAIGFNSDGLKDFETELKKSETELDKAEKDVSNLEKKLKDLEAAEKKDEKAIAQTSKALQEAKDKVELFKGSVEKLKNSSNYSLLQLKNNFAKLAKAAAGLAIVTATVKKSLDFYEQGEQLEFLAEKTGIAVEKLQLLGNAAKRYGGTTEGTAGTIESLRQQYQDARMGNVSGGMKQAYMKYGFQISADPEQTLQRLAAKMETMKSDTAKWDLAKSLGIDEGTTRLLIQGQAKYNEELKKANKYKLYTKEDIQRMRDYRQISQDIRMGIDNIFGSIYHLLLPSIIAVSKAIRVVTDWLVEHEGAIKIVGTVTLITAAVGGLILVVKALGIALKFLAGNKVALTIMGIVAVVTVLVAAIQDFVVFLQGGESIIEKLLQKMGFDVDECRQKCLNFFASIKNGVKSAIDWLKSLGGKFAELAQKIKEIWNTMSEPLKKLIGMRNPISGTYTAITTGKEIIKQYNENKLNSVPAGATSNYYQTQARNENSNQNAQTINNNNNKNSETIKNHTVTYNGVTINIKSNDPKEAAKELQAAMADIDNARFN